MTEIKTKTLLNNETVDAVDVPIKQPNEVWSEYLLEDGTTVRVKLAVGSILRAVDRYDPDDNPVYIVKGTVVTVPVVPDNLRKKK